MKIIDDTLKNKGKWDKQALTMFVSFCMTVLTGAYIVASDWFLDREINHAAIEVFYGFVVLSGGTGAINIWNKKVNRKSQSYNEYDEEPGAYAPGNNPNHPYNEISHQHSHRADR
jgi:hypothetical protein